jgi:hypothetical protein
MVVKFYICPLFTRTEVSSLPQQYVLRFLVCHTQWPELRSIYMPYYGPSIGPMCHLNDGTGYYGQIQGAILIFGSAV